MSSSPKVLLTGANGFIAVHVLQTFLDHGYTVVGTVRADHKATYLRNKFAPYGSKLDFVVVEDIGAPGAFDQVVKDNEFAAVLHTSSPCTIDEPDVERSLYRPAIQGTTEILLAIKQFGPTVKHVVVLSSFGAIRDTSKAPFGDAGYVYTEKDVNPVTLEEGLTNTAQGYYASKTFAEKAAWEFIEKEKPGFSLTVLCPPMVYGPPIQEVPSFSKLNSSNIPVYEYFSGKLGRDHMTWLWVDARDLALAHLLAVENPTISANQRYFVTAGKYSDKQIPQFIAKHYPDRAVVKHEGPLYPIEGTYDGDNLKSRRDLKIRYRDLETTMVDTFKRFKELEKELL